MWDSGRGKGFALTRSWREALRRRIINYSPSLADKLARSTSMHAVQEIAAEIIEVILGR